MIPKHIIIHHTASPRDKTTADIVDKYHQQKNWGTENRPAYASPSSLGWYGQYHFIIEADGKTTQYRDETEIGWHAGYMNDKSLGVCMTGWFDDGHDDMPTEAQQEALKTLVNNLRGRWNIQLDKVDFHRDYAKKSCPGYHITKEWLDELLGYKLTKEEKIMKEIQKIVMAKHDNPRAYLLVVDGSNKEHKGEQWFVKDGKKEKLNNDAAYREASFSAFSEKAFVPWDLIEPLAETKMLSSN